MLLRWINAMRAAVERRQAERRGGPERRGTLRWDPRAAERERRSGKDRRQGDA